MGDDPLLQAGRGERIHRPGAGAGHGVEPRPLEAGRHDLARRPPGQDRTHAIKVEGSKEMPEISLV